MAITPLVLPSTSSAESPSLVTVHPAAIATILDQHLRRPRSQDGQEQDRVLGTLMGSRNEVRSHSPCSKSAVTHASAAAPGIDETIEFMLIMLSLLFCLTVLDLENVMGTGWRSQCILIFWCTIW